MKVFIIAEAGVNHNGNIESAIGLIDAAVNAGADAIKFQSFKTDRLVCRTAPKAEYQKKTADPEETQSAMLKRLELDEKAHLRLARHAKEKGIIFMSTPFDEESADLLDRLGMSIFKIPSGEITNKPFIQYIALKGKPIILSTGMSDIGEVEKAIKWISEGRDGPDMKQSLTLLHCVSTYPARFEDVNLSAMVTMKNLFGLPVGYSDHTLGIEVSIAAVAMGATVIEKHFTLDRNMDGPDHKSSLEPGELNNMVRAIRNVEKAIGTGEKKCSVSEENIKLVSRKSLVAARDIKAGTVIKEKDLAVKRPGTGISPEFKDTVCGMIANNNIAADSVISWEHIKKGSSPK